MFPRGGGASPHSRAAAAPGQIPEDLTGSPLVKCSVLKFRPHNLPRPMIASGPTAGLGAGGRGWGYLNEIDDCDSAWKLSECAALTAARVKEFDHVPWSPPYSRGSWSPLTGVGTTPPAPQCPRCQHTGGQLPAIASAEVAGGCRPSRPSRDPLLPRDEQRKHRVGGHQCRRLWCTH